MQGRMSVFCPQNCKKCRLGVDNGPASACGRGQPSHTLAAMGRDPLAIDTAIRVSFCADNTPEDVDAFLNRFEDGMKQLQRIKK